MVSEAVENYLEAIYILIEERGKTRISDISSRLKVKASTVTEMVQKLSDRGFIIYERYRRDIRLTPKGEEEARRILKRHRVLKEFLQVLGVAEEIAEKDACRIEHHVHPETMRRLSKFIEFIQSFPKTSKWIKCFKRFCDEEDASNSSSRNQASCKSVD